MAICPLVYRRRNSWRFFWREPERALALARLPARARRPSASSSFLEGSAYPAVGVKDKVECLYSTRT